MHRRLLDMFSDTEFHLPGYKYFGPGTNLKKRLRRKDSPKNRLDAAAREHDIAYADAKDSLSKKHSADLEMADTISNFKDKSLFEKAVSYALRLKVLLGL